MLEKEGYETYWIRSLSPILRQYACNGFGRILDNIIENREEGNSVQDVYDALTERMRNIASDLRYEIYIEECEKATQDTIIDITKHKNRNKLSLLLFFSRILILKEGLSCHNADCAYETEVEHWWESVCEVGATFKCTNLDESYCKGRIYG